MAAAGVNGHITPPNNGCRVVAVVQVAYISVWKDCSMADSKPKRAGADAQKLYAYSVPADRIAALASTSFLGTQGITVFSPKPLGGLKSRKLKRISLPGGKEAIAVDDDQGPAVGLSDGAGLAKEAFRPSARSRAILRGKEYAYANLAESGGAFDLEETRTLLNGVSRQAVEKRVRDGSLLTVPGPGSRRSYPACQFTANGDVVKGIKETRIVFPSKNPWAFLSFLVSPNSVLGGMKPISLLASGDIETVISTAKGFGEQGG